MLLGYRSSYRFYAVVVAVLLDILHTASADELEPQSPTEKPNVTKTLDRIPKYHFQYYVKNTDSGDFKTQEESRDGEHVQGSYSVAEPNGDLRIVTYTADIKNGFKADVKIHRGGSPVSQQQAKTNRTIPRRGPARSNFTPSKPRYVNVVNMSPSPRTTSRAAPSRFESIGSGDLKTLGLSDLLKKPDSAQLGAKEIIEKDSVIVEMHLNDGIAPEELKTEPQKLEEKKIDEEVQSKAAEKIDTTSQKDELKMETSTLVNAANPATSSAIPKTSEVNAINETKLAEKPLQDKIKLEVEQIITSTLHQPTSVQEEIKKEAALADKDLRGIHHETSTSETRNTARSGNDKEELHISVHENVKTDDVKNRAQKKYSTQPRPLRLVEQVPIGNYQMQTLAEPVNMNPVENGNSYNNYDQPYGNRDGNTYTGNSNYYYDPTLAASVSNYYGNQGFPHMSGNSLKPQSLYDQYPAESQQYAIGYEWVKMNPRMVNSNGESYIVMDPDYSSTKTFFGYPRPTTLFHQLTKHRFKPHEGGKPQEHLLKPHDQVTKPQDNKYELNKPQDNKDQQPAASNVKEPVMIAQKAASLAQITAENSPKHDQQVPQYFKKDQEKLGNPNSESKNQTQKYLESLQAVPQPYPMDVLRVPAQVPSNGVIKQLPVIQPATINPIPAYAWPAGPVAINPAIAFILLPLQAAQDAPIQPLIVN